jgi:hypothetical protein
MKKEVKKMANDKATLVRKEKGDITIKWMNDVFGYMKEMIRDLELITSILDDLDSKKSQEISRCQLRLLLYVREINIRLRALLLNDVDEELKMELEMETGEEEDEACQDLLE